jgi:predicted DNA-binding ribbon-helix-helix protein
MPRKLIAFHPEDMRALSELAEDRATTLQELIDEAVRDLLNKHGRPTDLKSALRDSAKQTRDPARSR